MRKTIGKLIWRAGLLSCLAAMPGICRADTVYDGFTPGGTNADWGFGIVGSNSSSSYQELAAPFYVTNDYDLSQIDVPMHNLLGTNGLVLSLVADSGGGANTCLWVPGLQSVVSFPCGVPGTTIESWTLTNLPASVNDAGTSSIVETVAPVSTVSLLAGNTYWIVASPIAADSIDVWNVDNAVPLGSSLGPGGTFEYNSGSGWLLTLPQSSNLAFDVLGTPVPEPCMLLLLGIGLGSAYLRRRFISFRR